MVPLHCIGLIISPRAVNSYLSVHHRFDLAPRTLRGARVYNSFLDLHSFILHSVLSDAGLGTLILEPSECKKQNYHVVLCGFKSELGRIRGPWQCSYLGLDTPQPKLATLQPNHGNSIVILVFCVHVYCALLASYSHLFDGNISVLIWWCLSFLFLQIILFITNYISLNQQQWWPWRGRVSG